MILAQSYHCIGIGTDGTCTGTDDTGMSVDSTGTRTEGTDSTSSDACHNPISFPLVIRNPKKGVTH